MGRLQLTGADGQAGGASYSAEATQFFSRITDPGATRNDLYAALIDGLVADGVWSLLDVLVVLAADIAGNALVNLKSASYNPTAVNSPTFTADRGYAFASTKRLDSGFPPNAGGNYIRDSASLGCWIVAEGAGDGFTMGTDGAGFIAPLSHIGANFTGSTYARVNSTGSGANGYAVADGLGLHSGSRSGAATTKVYRNGSLLGTNADNSVAVISTNFWIGATNDAGSEFVPVQDQVGAYFFGGDLNGTKMLALYNRLRTYMTGVGVP